MARTVRDANLESRTARSRLPTRRTKPHCRCSKRGFSYRKLKMSAGKWVVRHHVGDQKYEVETIRPADDFSDADGTKILNFSQAQTRARELMVDYANKAASKTGPITVKHAIDSCIEFLETNRKSAQFSRYAADAFILPGLALTK
jgi:hypothetical protein